MRAVPSGMQKSFSSVRCSMLKRATPRVVASLDNAARMTGDRALTSRRKFRSATRRRKSCCRKLRCNRSRANRWCSFAAAMNSNRALVQLGREDDDAVEILSGLAVGETVAVTNTFTLKAELGKSEAEHAH